MDKPVKNTELIEFPYDASRRKYYFPAVASFRGKKITGMELCLEKSLPSGLSNVAVSATYTGSSTGAFLTLHSDGRDKVRQLPLSVLSPVIPNSETGRPFPAASFNHIIDGDKSYIELYGTLPAITGAAFGIIVGFED